MDAFEVNALDYLLKPYDQSRLRKALARARVARTVKEDGFGQSLQELLAGLADRTKGGYATRLLVRNSGQLFFVALADVIWIEGADYYVTLHTHGREILHKESLKNLEGCLDPANFARIHKSAIVNAAHIANLNPLPTGGMEIHMNNGRILQVSRRRKKQLLQSETFRLGLS